MRATFRGAPLNQARSLGERCKLPQRGLERSPSQNRIWCNLAIKSATILMILLRIDQLISVPENISFQKIRGSNTMFDPQVNFWHPVPAPLEFRVTRLYIGRNCCP